MSCRARDALRSGCATLSSATDAIRECVERIEARADGHPRRVAVDGITAAGKTTFADLLATAVSAAGMPVIRVSMDGFHNPRAVRYRQGRGSADGYYEDAYDLAAVRRVLLDPLGPNGDWWYSRAERPELRHPSTGPRRLSVGATAPP